MDWYLRVYKVVSVLTQCNKKSNSHLQKIKVFYGEDLHLRRKWKTTTRLYWVQTILDKIRQTELRFQQNMDVKVPS